MRRSTLALPILVIVLLSAAAALAQEGDQGVRLDIGHARYDATGTGLSVTASPETLELFQGGGGLTFHIADRPFALYDHGADDELWSVIVQSQVLIDIHAAIGFRYVDFAVVLPVAPVVVWGIDPTGGDFPVQDRDTGGLGDLVLIPKVRILDPAKRMFGLAVQIPVSLPTGHAARYLGDGGVGLAIDVLAELRLKRFSLLANLAPISLRPRVEYGGFVRQVGMTWSVGAAGRLGRTLDVRAEIWGSQAFQGEHGRTTAEWSVSISLRPTELLELEMGIGSGIVGLGTPRLRAFAGIRITSPWKGDADGDGVIDSADACPDAAEDPDGWDDSDGCPDPDNDLDGIPDIDDGCPDNAGPAAAGDRPAGCPELEEQPIEPEPAEQAPAPTDEEAAPGDETAPVLEDDEAPAAPDEQEAAPAPADDEAPPAPDEQEAPPAPADEQEAAPPAADTEREPAPAEDASDSEPER
jgi:large repetitive protein